MNITAFDIYIWQTLDGLRDVFSGIGAGLCIVGGFASIFLGVGYIVSHQYESADAKLLATLSAWLCRALAGLILGVISFVFSALVPSSDTWAMMHVIPEIAESRVIQQDIPRLYDAAMKALERAIAPPEQDSTP